MPHFFSVQVILFLSRKCVASSQQLRARATLDGFSSSRLPVKQLWQKVRSPFVTDMKEQTAFTRTPHAQSSSVKRIGCRTHASRFRSSAKHLVFFYGKHYTIIGKFISCLQQPSGKHRFKPGNKDSTVIIYSVLRNNNPVIYELIVSWQLRFSSWPGGGSRSLSWQLWRGCGSHMVVIWFQLCWFSVQQHIYKHFVLLDKAVENGRTE